MRLFQLSLLILCLCVAVSFARAKRPETVSIKLVNHDLVEPSVLKPGSRIIAGNLEQNEFFILDKNESLPVKLITSKMKALARARMQQKFVVANKQKAHAVIKMHPIHMLLKHELKAAHAKSIEVALYNTNRKKYHRVHG